MDYKLYFGISSVLVALFGYSFYFRELLQRKTQPHGVTWLIWSMLTGVTGTIQLLNGGSSGAWVTLTTSFFTGLVFLLSFKYGHKDINKTDKLLLILSIIAILIWLTIDNALIAVVLATAIQVSGFIPTFRKVFKDPDSETAITFFSNGAKFALGFAALGAYSLETVFFPMVVGVVNTLLAIVIVALPHVEKLRPSD